MSNHMKNVAMCVNFVSPYFHYDGTIELRYYIPSECNVFQKYFTENLVGDYAVD
jgi:hypothetical protein